MLSGEPTPQKDNNAGNRIHRIVTRYPDSVLHRTILILFTVLSAFAEVRTLTLRQALELAQKQSPDVMVARLDEQKAQAAIRIVRDPFTPKVFAGSGAAKTWGYPSAINGQPPSIVEAQAVMSLFNRPQSWEVARVRENARGAGIDTQSKSDDVLFRVASLYVDAAQAARTAEFAGKEVEALTSAAQAVQARVSQGYELPIEGKRADLNLARTRQRAHGAAADQDYTEAALATVLGFPDTDRVRAVPDDPNAQNQPAALEKSVPESEEAAVETALQNSRELRLLQSQLQAANFAVQEQKAQRLPQVDLVAQYALFAKYNYTGYFTTFRRNNAELGLSFKIPLLTGSAVGGARAQAEADMARVRIQMNNARSRIAADARKSYGELKQTEEGRTVARLDLDVARDQLSILLAQLDEGRATRRQVDEARFVEQEKWIVLYQTEYAVERARLALLRQTSRLSAALTAP
jgi:outer membrane protein TolC